MKISLWQQFSSNHSASFTVVGQFDTVQKAADAELKLRTLFEDIQLYWAGVSRADERPPSWAELEASQTYDIEWDKSLDWVDESVDKHLMRFEQYVFVTTALATTSQCSDTMEHLMGKLADETYVERSECGQPMLVFTELRCNAPSEKIASDIVVEIRDYLAPATVEGSIPPWEIFSPRLEMSVYDLVRRPYDSEPESDIIAKAIDALYHYQKAVRNKYRVTLAESAAIAALFPLRDQGYSFPVQPSADNLPQIAREVGYLAHSSAWGGRIENQGQVIQIPEIVFFKPHYGIPALVGYLKSKGCEEINYALKTVPYDARPEYLYR